MEEVAIGVLIFMRTMIIGAVRNRKSRLFPYRANHLNLGNPEWIEYITPISERLAYQKSQEHSGNPHH